MKVKDVLQTGSIVADVNDYVVQAAKGRRVLYLGASDLLGRPAAILSELQASACDLYAGDQDTTFVEGYASSFQLFHVDLNEPFSIPFTDIDLVIMTEVLEHLHSPVTTLRRLSSLLPEREILTSVPGGLSVGRIIQAMFRPHSYSDQDGYHLMVFNPMTILNTFDEAHVSHVEIHPYERHAILRPLVRMRPLFAGGFVVRGRLSSVP